MDLLVRVGERRLKAIFFFFHVLLSGLPLEGATTFTVVLSTSNNLSKKILIVVLRRLCFS